jgi:hypothetical protein
MKTINVGDKITTWFSDNLDGKSTVISIVPYTGTFNKFFTHIVRVTSPKTSRGWMELCVKLEY